MRSFCAYLFLKITIKKPPQTPHPKLQIRIVPDFPGFSTGNQPFLVIGIRSFLRLQGAASRPKYDKVSLGLGFMDRPRGSLDLAECQKQIKITKEHGKTTLENINKSLGFFENH